MNNKNEKYLYNRDVVRPKIGRRFEMNRCLSERDCFARENDQPVFENYLRRKKHDNKKIDRIIQVYRETDGYLRVLY